MALTCNFSSSPTFLLVKYSLLEFGRMCCDHPSLTKFKQSLVLNLGGDLTAITMSLVTVKYNGSIFCYNSDDPQMQHVIPGLVPSGGGYYICASFDSKRDAKLKCLGPQLFFVLYLHHCHVC